MFLTWLMLAVALCLSTIAAFYSIIGLTAIFAAAVIPVAIMGTILEIAKLTVTVWLHEYWRQCKRTMKAYLVPAVGILMLITSMGIFGFLSKAHLDQAVPAGDITSQVQIYDEKIRTQRDNIEAARNALRQMDAQVDQVLGRTTDDKGAERAVQIRRQQAAERTRLQNDISRAQTEIQRLQEQRAPVAAQARRVEAEVGPIKYIAALIYGDNPDQSLLEKAVRWVIIILVTVFDPLAIFMLLAATESYKWEKYGRKKDDNRKHENPPQQPVNDALVKTKTKISAWWQTIRDRKNGTDVDSHDGTSKGVVDQSARIAAVDEPLVPASQPIFSPKIEYKIIDDADEETVPIPPDNDDLYDVADDEIMREAKRRWKADHPHSTLKEQRRLVTIGRIPYEPWLDYLPDATDPRMGFGQQWPVTPRRGDMWVRTDSQPTRLYKYNGAKWIETAKSLSDVYVQDDGYIDHLIERISRGHYDPELLTDAERDQIENKLRKDLS